MQANGFSLETAREHEAHLVSLAAPAKFLPPRPPTRHTRSVWLLHRRRRRVVPAALDVGA
jgi:hypothetical protein